VRKNADPDLAAAFYVTRHRDTGRFDLPVRDPRRLQCLEAKITKAELLAARRFPAHAALHHSSVLDLFRHQHNSKPQFRIPDSTFQIRDPNLDFGIWNFKILPAIVPPRPAIVASGSALDLDL